MHFVIEKIEKQKIIGNDKKYIPSFFKKNIFNDLKLSKHKVTHINININF